MSEHVANFLVGEIENRNDMTTQLFDVRDFDFPKDNYGQDIKGEFPEWRDAATRSDGIIIISPEYNHSFPGPLKSALDVLLPEFKHKVGGIVGVSAGPWGGTRVIESLVPIMRYMGLMPSSLDLNFPSVSDVFDEDGNIKDRGASERAKKFLDELSWLSRSMKWGRDNIK